MKSRIFDQWHFDVGGATQRKASKIETKWLKIVQFLIDVLKKIVYYFILEIIPDAIPISSNLDHMII